MYEAIKLRALRLLKVPPEPTDPMGEVGGRNTNRVWLHPHADFRISGHS